MDLCQELLAKKAVRLNFLRDLTAKEFIFRVVFCKIFPIKKYSSQFSLLFF